MPVFWGLSRNIALIFIALGFDQVIRNPHWCTTANSIIDMMTGKEIPLALSPCLKYECDQWKDWECVHIRKVGK